MTGRTWLEDLIDLNALGVHAAWAPLIGGLVHALLIGGVLSITLRIAEQLLTRQGAAATSTAVRTLRKPLPRVGIWLGALETVRGLPLPDRFRGGAEALLASCALLMVASAALHAGAVGLSARAQEPDAPRWLRPHTVPRGVLLWRVLVGSLACLQAGLEADNYPVLKELSNFERGQLKDAFGLIQSMQNVLSQRYKF